MLAAALLAVAAAVLAVGKVEQASESQVTRILGADGHDWVDVSVDGLQVILSGTAPDEATRFRALSLAGQVVDAARVRDQMEVDPGEPFEPPRFSIEILRNDDGISLIGLVPGAMDREAVASRISELSEGAEVTDLLETAEYPVPQGWAEALSYSLDALAQLPRSKISVASDRVEITAITNSGAEKRKLETSLNGAKPAGLNLKLDLSAPRPVITPFTLRFLIDGNGARFDACSAHTETGRERILAAPTEAGLAGKADCTLGLGVPSPRWPDAVSAAISALAELGGGSVTFSDADITLVALDTTEQALFDRVVGELESALPEVFSLQSVLPEPVKIDGTGASDGPPEFVATYSPEGLVQLRGRIGSETMRNAAEGFARARFSGAEVSGTMRIDPELPKGWPTRVLTALEALSLLNNGSAVVQPEFVAIKGASGDSGAKAEISRILSAQLGGTRNFSLDVTYREELDPLANLPTPEECVNAINAILTARKLTFEPGSGDLDGEAFATIDRIAEVLNDCAFVPMEIAGHTDSQGREVMNQRLSQERADSVLQALFARRVPTSNLRAVGYGETVPIADNGSEEGREANRRIEFTLIEFADSAEAAAHDGHDHGDEAPPEETETGPENE